MILALDDGNTSFSLLLNFPDYGNIFSSLLILLETRLTSHPEDQNLILGNKREQFPEAKMNENSNTSLSRR